MEIRTAKHNGFCSGAKRIESLINKELIEVTRSGRNKFLKLSAEGKKII